MYTQRALRLNASLKNNCCIVCVRSEVTVTAIDISWCSVQTCVLRLFVVELLNKCAGVVRTGTGKTDTLPVRVKMDRNKMDLFKSSNNYEEINIIGKGAYGMVFKARDKINNTIVALKKVKVPLTEDGIPLNTLREIALLKQLDTHEHPNIVRLLDICHGQKLEKELIMFLVFEHLEQDLSSYLEKCQSPYGLGPMKIRKIAQQILEGVDFLHSHRIIHRDLKPQNILVTNDERIKLADFGLAKTYDFDMRLTVVVVTLWYRAPEVLFGLSYATPVDIWSVGCILAELYTLKPIFCGTSEIDQLNKIFRILGKPPESEWPKDYVSIQYHSFEVQSPLGIHNAVPNMSENAYDLIKKMLAFDPSKRISALEALNHVYFTEEPLDS